MAKGKLPKVDNKINLFMIFILQVIPVRQAGHGAKDKEDKPKSHV